MEFRGEYAYLSNMYTCTINIRINNFIYSFLNAEAAFQAMKCPERASEFINLDGPSARKLGNKVLLRNDWEQEKVNFMRNVIYAKFIQNRNLLEKLCSTIGVIVESSKYGDKFWGVNANGIGENHLGLILTELRDRFNNTLMVSFTGRRPKDLYGYNHDAYLQMVDAIKVNLRYLYSIGYRLFISGGAQGFDQLAFWAVNALKREGYTDIRNIVYVPFVGQQLAWKKTGLFSQAEYNLMLSLADEVYYLKIIDTNNKKQVISALYDRNHAMVDTTNLTFGLYPDYSWQMESVKGGTAECLRYAHMKQNKIFQLSNESLLSQMITF